MAINTRTLAEAVLLSRCLDLHTEAGRVADPHDPADCQPRFLSALFLQLIGTKFLLLWTFCVLL